MFISFQKSRHHRLQETHSSNIAQVPVTDESILPLPTIKTGDEYVEPEEDVEEDDDGDENEEEGEESAEVLEKQSEYPVKLFVHGILLYNINLCPTHHI